MFFLQNFVALLWCNYLKVGHMCNSAFILFAFTKLNLFKYYRSSLGTAISRRTMLPASPSCEIWGLVFGFLFSVALSVVEGLKGNSNRSVNMAYLSSAEYVLECIHYSSMLVAASSAVALTYRYIPSKV